MGRESFRFLHASDFHLERPLQDLPDLPDHLKPAFIDAPWKAAEAVFEHAIIENVDFVILCGDLLHPIASGACGPAFLLDQFESLRQRGTAVYWAGGVVDDVERWPGAVTLPDNVHRFSKRMEAIVHRRSGSPLATILGRSSDGRQTIRAAEYGHEADDNYRIAVGVGEADLESLVSERMDYWALGGLHDRTILKDEGQQLRYCGSPQGRSMSEAGAHGCYLVDVNSQRQTQVHSLELDLFRYSDQTIDADDMALGKDIRQMMTKRINRLQAEAQGRHLLVRWRIQMDLENASVVGPAALEELIVWLRREFGYGQPAVWSTDIEVLPPKSLPQKWQEEDTILGDFLRTTAEQRKHGAKPIPLESFIAEETPGGAVWQAALLETATDSSKDLIDLATLLGVDLLRGHKIDLLSCTRRFGGLPAGEAWS
jgi:DNA repair exonuclease SbcCD nuclease subunit